MRMHCLAGGLVAAGHDAYLVSGGRPVPRPRFAVEPEIIVLPTLRRTDGGALVGGDGEEVRPLLRRRAATLADAVTAIRPDVVLVDHYPFSKWELAEEIEGAIAAARRADDRARAVCSLPRHRSPEPPRNRRPRPLCLPRRRLPRPWLRRAARACRSPVVPPRRPLRGRSHPDRARAGDGLRRGAAGARAGRRAPQHTVRRRQRRRSRCHGVPPGRDRGARAAVTPCTRRAGPAPRVRARRCR